MNKRTRLDDIEDAIVEIARSLENGSYDGITQEVIKILNYYNE